MRAELTADDSLDYFAEYLDRISGAAIRAQAKHFVAYADNLAAKLAAVR